MLYSMNMKEKMFAWAVHAYTSLGLVTGLFALRATMEGEMGFAFFWLAMSVIIDATDGPLARRFHSAEVLPGFNGRTLDDIVDYLNYVFVPAFILVRAGLLSSWGWALIPLVSSAYGFSRKDAKTPDGYFTGFPSYWNVIALYLYLFKQSSSLNALIVTVFGILVFIPVHYIDPFKTSPLRRITVPLTIAWGLAILSVIALMPDPPPPLVHASFAYVCYYMLASFWTGLKRAKRE